MPAVEKIAAATIAVTAIGATGQATLIVAAKQYDLHAMLYAPAPGIYIGSVGIRQTGQGAELPTGVWVTFPVPANSTLYALSAMGTIQLSYYVAPVLATVDARFAQAVEALVEALRVALNLPAPQSAAPLKLVPPASTSLLGGR